MEITNGLQLSRMFVYKINFYTVLNSIKAYIEQSHHSDTDTSYFDGKLLTLYQLELIDSETYDDLINKLEKCYSWREQ